MPDHYVYTASGELTEYTFETYDEAYAEITKYDTWGVILKHKPYTFGEERPQEHIVYEHLPHLKP